MTADQAVGFIMAFYGPRQEPTSAACSYLREVLDAMGPPEARAVLARRLVEASPRFPTIERVRAVWKAIKPPPPPETYHPVSLPMRAAPDAPCNPEHARASFALIHRIMSGKLKGAALVEPFRDMHRRWPDFGWDEAVEQTESELGM